MTKKVYFSHDGGVDDLASLTMLLSYEQQGLIELVGVGVVPADSYLEPAVAATRKIINRFSKHHDLLVSASDAKSSDPFPKEWRMDSFTVDALPILNEFGEGDTELSYNTAADDLATILTAATEPITLVFTGPVSDLGTVLEQDLSLADKIDRLVVMAGTFGAGNIAEPEQDGTAEWNVFWDPQAFKVVFDSNIKIQMVGLESTHEVPLTPADRLRWAKLRSHPVMDFIGQAYATVPVLTHFETNSTYFLWDVLTTAFAQNPALVETKQMTVDVVPTGQSRGRTFETPAGRDIEFVYHVDDDAFFKFFEETILAIENY
ncbi:nucleoside hydrolase [Weissella cibaria]|uniref:nucleoside hydrolase n=1 Tax=Weissella cibaria TaxID=137591 RepID=UPI001C1FA16B|nr:nucleoside hydrolase [Weissella cibaria]MBU7544456.1 nucleoside hydrolase [Weissella cibaria]MCV3318150.1 nucleoside hydrolase [Weissella cibaria]